MFSCRFFGDLTTALLAVFLELFSPERSLAISLVLYYCEPCFYSGFLIIPSFCEAVLFFALIGLAATPELVELLTK
jgi:hypothetical protein